jgi:hypothetical protein
MRITARTVGLVVACSLWACTAATPQPPAPEPVVPALDDDPATSVDESALVIRAVIPPTPELLKAALTNDPDVMRDAVATLTSCQASSACPSQFGACTNWSAPSLCSSVCGPTQCFCKPIRLCEGEPPVPRGTDQFNAFRVCFDANQNACTEWQLTTSTFCGC